MQAGYPEVVSSEIAKTISADGFRLTGRQHYGARQDRERDVGTAESKTPGQRRRGMATLSGDKS